MEKETNKQIAELVKALGKTQSKQVEDFDSALLNNLFEDISGSPRDKFDKVTERLIKVASRLEKIKIDNQNNDGKNIKKEEIETEKENKEEIEEKTEGEDILTQINTFLDDAKLPAIYPDVEDYKQREGRIITIKRDDTKTKFTCVMDAYDKTIDRITEEQYFVLINKARKLLYQATAKLNDTVIPWHKDDLIVEVDPSIDEETKEDVDMGDKTGK